MRLFFALWPPPAAVEQLSEIARSAADQFGGKPTRSESIHLTLAFLGDVPEERLPSLIETAQTIRAGSFDLAIDVLGYWQRNNLLWAGLGSPCAGLNHLVGNLQKSLVEAGFSVSGWGRPYTPHVTLIRKVLAADIPSTLPGIEPVRWSCAGFALVHSQLSDLGSSYRTVGEFGLNACSA